VLVYYKADIIIISLKYNLFLPCYSWKIAHLALRCITTKHGYQSKVGKVVRKQKMDSYIVG